MAKTQTVKLVLLGTGTPNAEPDRAGSAAAVVVGQAAYLVDFGPGVVRQANAAAKKGIPALKPKNLRRAFLTHLHSDHTAGYPDLIFTPWVLGRANPLQVWGPPGTKAMTDHLLAAYEADIHERLYGLEPANSKGYGIAVSEIERGLVYVDDAVRVAAIRAQHVSWAAYSYKFVTHAGTIIIAGDTAPYPGIANQYRGCDILLHEVYSTKKFRLRAKKWQAYHATVHTSATELASIAADAHPRQLVLTHQLLWGQTPQGLLAEISEEYDGAVAFGQDLDVFELPNGN